MYLLGYDIGSAFIQAALIDAHSGLVIDKVQYPDGELDVISRHSGWAEQHPEIWWKYVCQSTKILKKRNKLRAEAIKAVGISYQMHGLVLVDANHQVLRPSIIWCDSRAVPIGQQAFKEMGEKFCLQNFLNSPGNFTASRLKWIKDNEPSIYARIHKILLPGDYIAMKFSGALTTTISGLSEQILWNFKEKRIATEVLEYYGLDSSLLPQIVGTFTDALKVNKSAAKETGLKKGTLIAYRAGDQPNNALSLNVSKPGEIAATSGASGVVYGVVDTPVYDMQSRVNSFAHVNYEKNHDRIGVLLCINGAGIQYSWLKNQIARSNQSFDDMERMVSSVPVGSEGVCVLPFGNGAERIFNNRNLESHINNIEFNRHTRAHMYRAALEGVAFSFIYGIGILKEMGLQINKIRVGNENMFLSKVFSMTIATLLSNQIDVYDTTGAVGAARASGIGLGHYHSVEDALIGVSPIKSYEPSLNYGLCNQAYNYWLSSLDKVLNISKNASVRIKNLEQQKDSLAKEILLKDQKIITKSLELDRFKTEIETLKKELKGTLKNVANEKTKDRLRLLAKKIDRLQKEDVWQTTFRDNLGYLTNGYVTKLRTVHPELSMEDLKLSYLLTLKLSSKEMAQQLGLSIRGVETKRYRLRKKLKLTKAVKLITYLEEIPSEY